MTTNNDLQQMPAIDECYVKISDLKKAIERNRYDPEKDNITAYLRYLKYNTPLADVVPVVRCKDCKYWDLGWKSQEDPLQKFCPMIEWVTEIDFYCAYGERRTDD